MFGRRFSTTEIVNASTKRKYRKAPGCDGVNCRTYQIKWYQYYGPDEYDFQYNVIKVFVSDHFKKGYTYINIYKGGGKKREVKESHRRITLGHSCIK